MTKHAILSPSGFKAIMLCPAKPAMERDFEDSSSEFADEGSAAHFLGSEVLENKREPSSYIGTAICVSYAGVEWSPITNPREGRVFVVDQDMADYVRTYAQVVKDLQGPDGELFVEQAVPIGHITGEDGAEGTSDAVILRGDEIIVVDLKYGRGVEVSAERNPQLMLYALGALEKFGLAGDFKRVRMVISQPRVSSAPSEWDCSVEELLEWAENEAKPAAAKAMVLLDAMIWADDCNPHPEACRFCKAKATCPALANKVEEALGAEFTDLTTADKVEQEAIIESLTPRDNIVDLGAKMDAVELVEMWCKAIRGRVESVLLAGGQVAGYKLVAGHKGARAWVDAEKAEEVMKSMRLKKDEMYDFKLISPTTAEKLLKATPKRWKRVEDLTTQTDGKPSVAPMSDKRPALEVKPVSEEFTAIQDDVGDLV